MSDNFLLKKGEIKVVKVEEFGEFEFLKYFFSFFMKNREVMCFLRFVLLR